MSLSCCAGRVSSPIGNSRSLSLENLETRRLFVTSIGGWVGPSNPFDNLFLTSAPTVLVAKPPVVNSFPAVPMDDKIGPVADCPDLDSRFCLPKDVPLRPTRHVAKFGLFFLNPTTGTFNNANR